MDAGAPAMVALEVSMSFPDDTLERALAQAAVDPGARAAFYATLREAQVWCFAPPAADAAEPPAVQPCLGADGPFVPVFSSPEHLRAAVAARPGFGAMAVAVADVFPVLAAHGLAVQLNPGAPHGKTFAPDEVRAIADGTVLASRRLELDDAIAARVRPARAVSRRLTARLAAVFARWSDVAEAWLGELVLADEAPHLVVGVKAAHGYGGAVAEAGAVAQGFLSGGQVIDFLHVAYACAPDGIAGWLVRETRPFYQRDRRRWWRW